MKRTIYAAFALVCLASFSLPAMAHPSAARIAAKNAAARGGLKAWRKVHSMIIKGELDAGGKSNARLPYVLELKRPHKRRLELQFAGKTALQVYDGAHGWKLRPFLGRDDAEPFSPAEAKQAAETAELDGPLIDYRKKGTRIAYEGIDKVEGKRAYKLKLRSKSGHIEHLWIDAKTFLDLKIDGAPRKLDGKMHKVAVMYRNYRRVNGLMIPHELDTVVAGVKQTRKISIERVTINPPLENNLFAKPQTRVASVGGH
jgi:hypothetical protein